jgi:hypothetical protein
MLFCDFRIYKFRKKNSYENKIILSILWEPSSITFTSWFALSPTYTGASLFGIATSACFAYLFVSNTSKSKA